MGNFISITGNNDHPQLCTKIKCKIFLKKIPATWNFLILELASTTYSKQKTTLGLGVVVAPPFF
jgi:hypothetical protein